MSCRQGEAFVLIFPADLGLRLKPKLQVAARGTSVLLPNFLRTLNDLLLDALRLPTLPQPLLQILNPRPQPFYSRLISGTRSNPGRLFDLAF